MTKDMSKRITSLFLAFAMLLQILIPQNIFAEGDKSLPQDKYVKVGMLDGKSYDAKIMNELNRIAAKNRKSSPGKPGVRLFSSGPYFGDNNEPKDADKPKYFGNVSANLELVGLDGNEFQWNEIFGVDESGNPKPAQIIFRQMDEESSTDTGIEYILQITKGGKYTWSDGAGKPTKLPLFSKSLKPYRYEVRIDERVSDKVKLLTEVIFGTEGSSPTFSPENADGEIIANITLGLTYQQIASTKFKSEWHTDVVEADRPAMNANFAFDDEGDGVSPVSVELPKNDKDTKIIRDWNNDFDPDLVISYYLEKTPDVTIDETTTGLTFEENNGVKTVKSGDHKFKYDFTYDVITGGKLTMTEILPVTFDANGGKFASITEEGADQKIVKEVKYDDTLTDKAENPTKERETFKGWSTTQDGKNPVTDQDLKNITKAKTFYAIWESKAFTADGLTVHESFKGDSDYVNDFIPTLEKLKGQVKVDGKALTDQDKLEILNDEGQPLANETAVKDYLYTKLGEVNDNKIDRTVEIKGRVTDAGGKTHDVTIPIKVIKNIYEAKTKEGKPVYVPENYVKVTLDPTTKATNPQKSYYYVNPAAKVVIPGKNPTGTEGNVFTKWTMKADSATGDGEDYNLPARHQFGEASTITAQYEKEKQGTINIKYVDENGKEIDPKYHKDGVDYPATKEGKLGDYADDRDYPKPGPDFKGYIYSSRESIKGKKYKDPTDPDNLDIVTYKYYKKVTTDTPKNPYVYFPVIFDANGGKFGTDTQKTVYVYFKEDEPDAVKVTFSEVREEVEKAYGKPTKENENFIEWQDKADKGSKPADDYEIQFKGWDSQTYEAIAETFYAHYAKASALISYLDLDGKPIADDFKIDGVEYPTEKDGKLDEAIASDVFTADTAPKLIGYKFNRIELNPVNSKYALENKATIKIYYEKLPDVIPKKDGSGDPNEKPNGYVEVKFVPTDKAKDTSEKIFYVNPKKEVTIPIANPVAIATYTFKEWKMGANAEGEVYTPGSPKKFTQDTTITATYGETENIIPYDPSATDPMPRPEGYVRVTFAADPGLKLTEQKAYYVKKNAGIKLGNDELKKPAYEAQTGYKFKEWDKKDDTVIETADIVVTAKATKLDNVIPEKDGEDNPNTKPEGYKEVIFKIKDEDKAKGSITGVAKFYVNPNEYVKITPPATEAKTGYVFGSWGKDTTIPTVYKADTTITGSFNGPKDVIPKTNPDGTENKQPAGYVKVTFVILPENAGKIAAGESEVYYVIPNKDVTITPPKTSPNVGYKFRAWSPDPAAPTKYTMPNTEVYGNFEKIGDFIPSTDKDGKSNPKPEGYVTVIFTDGKYGTITSGKKVYYVNPNANVKMSDLTFARNSNRPVVTPDVGYKFNAWLNEKSFVIKDDFEIKEDLVATAEYNPLDDVIPKDKPTGGENKQPERYITVTFKTTDKAGSVEKVVYVNPEKAVELEGYAPKVNPITGYEFADWDRPIKEKIQYKDKDVITAQFNEIGNVSKIEKPGYVKVEFKPGDNGKLTGDTNLWIKPGVEVTIPAPDVKPSVGYKFDKWDKDLTVNLAADAPTYEITARYEALEDIIPQKNTDGSDKPNGYKTVKFVGEHGTLAVDTVFYVNPEKVVDFTNTVKGFTKTPDFSYTEVGGTWSPEEFNKKFTDDTTFTFTFAKLADVIPEKKPDGTSNVQPKDYVKVTLIPTDKATDDTNKVFFVNPKENVVIPSMDPVGKKITDANGNTYTFTFKEWTSARGIHGIWKPGDEIKGTFTQDTDITAKYNVKAEKLVNGPIAKDNVVTPKGDVPNAGDLIKNIPGSEEDPLPDGTTFSYKDNKNPDLSEPGEKTVIVEVHYPNGKTVVVEVPIKVVDHVVPQKGGEDGKKPLVPDNYVKVTVDTTDKATDNTKFVKVFWVKPNVEVTIPGILAPTGKSEKDADGVTKTNIFDKWKREGADSEKFYTNEIKDIFAEKTDTKIVALYTQDENVEPTPDNGKWIPKGSTPSAKDFIKNVYNDDDPNNPSNLPPGTKFEFANGNPDTNTPGTNKPTKITVTYPNGEVKTVDVTYNVTGDVVEQPDPNKKPDVPDNFVQVTVDPTNQAKDPTKHVFWVNPEKVVTIPATDPTAKDASKIFKSWDGLLTQQFKNDTIITAQYGAKPADPRPTTDYVVTELGVQPKPQDYEKAITQPAGKRIKDVQIVDRPNVDKPGKTSATVKVIYEDGTTDQITVPVFVQKKDTPTPELRPYPVPGDCNNTCDQPNQPNKPNQPNQPNVGKDALNTTDHYQYLIGYPDGNFAPNKGMTRAEAATMFTRLLNERPVKWRHYDAGLSDIRPGDWYANTVGYAVQRGIVSGYPDGSFKPNKPITRAEFAAIASRFDALAQGNAISFSDLAPSHWGYNAIRSAATKGWISGYPDNTFRPEQAITRAEVTAITNRMLNRHADLYWIDAHPSEVIRFGDVKRSDWYFEPIMEATMGHDFIRDRDKKTEHWTGINGKSFI